MIQVGSKINEYEVVARLRSGGMAALYLGRRVGAAGFSRPVAIKVIHPHLSEDKNFVTMFVDEAKLSARISHPNVVHVEELGQRGSFYYLVMEYVHGCSLSQLIRSLRARGRRFTPEMATYIAIQTAEGLHAAHETVGDDGELLGVVHRDVSPQNVLLSYRGHTKLIDFGVAKARGRSQHTTVASLKGKLRYMAPEQAASQPVDRRTDVYALGIVLWEMLTMRTLFKADNDLKLHDLVKNPVVEPPSKYASSVPKALDDVVMRALSPNPADRPANAQEFRRLLVQAVPGALAIDSEQLSDLLCTVMVDTIRDQHRRLPETIGAVLKREVGQALDDTSPSGVDEGDNEVLQTLTTSASSVLLGEDGPIDSRGSHSVSVAQREPMFPGGPVAEQSFEQTPQPKSRQWVKWVAIGLVMALVGLASYVAGGRVRTSTAGAGEGEKPRSGSPAAAAGDPSSTAQTPTKVAAPAPTTPLPSEATSDTSVGASPSPAGEPRTGAGAGTSTRPATHAASTGRVPRGGTKPAPRSEVIDTGSETVGDSTDLLDGPAGSSSSPRKSTRPGRTTTGPATGSGTVPTKGESSDSADLLN